MTPKPTKREKMVPIKTFVTPEEFRSLDKEAYRKCISISALIRSKITSADDP